MPPKRKSTESLSAIKGSKSKRPRSDESPDASDILPNPRYTKGSITSFYDVLYKEILVDTKKAFGLVSLCEWNFVGSPDNDETEDTEEDQSETEEDQSETKKDSVCYIPFSARYTLSLMTTIIGKKFCQDPCVCRKPTLDNPNHPWVVSYAGLLRASIVELLANVREPWVFSLHTFKYHQSYGLIELLENLLLDFDEEEGNWKNQWAICEAIGLIFTRGTMELIDHVDDPNCLFELCRLVQIMFLTMLATLERQNLLGPDSEVKNLGVVMGMYVLVAAEIGSKKRNVLVGGGIITLGSSNLVMMDTKLSKTRHTSNVIMGYADKYGFKPQSPRDLVNELARRKIKSPRLTIPLPTAKKNDPWNWKKTLEEYKGGPVGGDRLDMTSWKPEERAKHCFDKSEDPLTQSALDAFKRGELLFM
ncbi:uncharacterized protein N7483_001238 [Penicillium malachiteum]|uniref:uncharacterized protein n=1 Tax=Penicillium malachiteum TaxID=1324776 RepID=UPI002547E30F|nr:uncharacterized protein N7483_001238 [Penicillium malachiteum]KAJ5736113.1 hypothetical protein N7483_001238 [Penicillium malachiteum]